MQKIEGRNWFAELVDHDFECLSLLQEPQWLLASKARKAGDIEKKFKHIDIYIDIYKSFGDGRLYFLKSVQQMVVEKGFSGIPSLHS